MLFDSKSPLFDKASDLSEIVSKFGNMPVLSVTETITHFLRYEIVMGRLPAGVKLNENEMSRQYGISRPPLREALRKLEQEGLVVSFPRKGTYVTEISLEDCKEVYFARNAIECGAIDAIAEGKNTDLAALHEFIEDGESDDIPEKSDASVWIRYYNIIAGFHWRLLQASGNRWLNLCYNSIGSALARYQIIYLGIPGIQKHSRKDHLEILRLIEAENYKKAKEVLTKHIFWTLDRVVEQMSTMFDSEPTNVNP